jgi:enamine deaminase RidA (YjgF/YER057c/UK114 family)
LEHVVKITNYFVDISDLAIFREVRDSAFDTKAPPASTAVQIGKLARDGLLFEIEAIAVVPDK